MALFVKEVEAATQPSEEAIRAASAGYESETLFHEALRCPTFFSESSESNEWMRDIEEALKNQNKTRLLDVVHSKKMFWLDKAYLILMLEELGFSDEAFFPLYDAVKSKHETIISMLLNAGASEDVNVKDEETHKSPLDLAIEIGDLDIINMLTSSLPMASRQNL